MDERKPTEVIREAADWCIECPGQDKRSAYLRDMQAYAHEVLRDLGRAFGITEEPSNE